MGFNIGDKVIIYDVGQMYTSYNSFVKKYAHHKLSSFIYSNRKLDNGIGLVNKRDHYVKNVLLGGVYTVIARGDDRDLHEEGICLIERESGYLYEQNRVYLVHEDGLKEAPNHIPLDNNGRDFDSKAHQIAYENWQECEDQLEELLKDSYLNFKGLEEDKHELIILSMGEKEQVYDLQKRHVFINKGEIFLNKALKEKIVIEGRCEGFRIILMFKGVYFNIPTDEFILEYGGEITLNNLEEVVKEAIGKINELVDE